MLKPLRIAFTPTHDRPEMYQELRRNIDPQVDYFVTIAHGVEAQQYSSGIILPFDEPYNLATMWNMGFDKADELADGNPYFVACLNDDTLVADDWFDRMVEAIERDGSAGASTPRQPNKMRSIFGGAFVVKGGLGVRMSGVARHWYTDDEIQKLCQVRGGFSIVHGVYAVNRLANRGTRANPELQAMSAEDWPKFKAMYGMPEAPWDAEPVGVVISAPSGVEPVHLLATVPQGQKVLVLEDGWETDQLAVAASRFDRFVFLKESCRVFDGFWDVINSRSGSCWLFARPSCYMGVYDSRTLRVMLSRLPRTVDKEGSIANEWAIHGTVDWDTIWPEISDRNALRMENNELVIGNRFIEKLKGTARCSKCPTVMGVCDHLRP